MPGPCPGPTSLERESKSPVPALRTCARVSRIPTHASALNQTPSPQPLTPQPTAFGPLARVKIPGLQGASSKHGSGVLGARDGPSWRARGAQVQWDHRAQPLAATSAARPARIPRQLGRVQGADSWPGPAAYPLALHPRGKLRACSPWLW